MARLLCSVGHGGPTLPQDGTSALPSAVRHRASALRTSLGHGAPMLLIALLALLPLAGCPYYAASTDGGAAGSSSSNQNNNSLTGGAGSNPPAILGQADSLEERFPGCHAPADADATRDRVWELLNEQRQENSLQPLARNAVLDAEAEQYACEMISYDFFAHVNPVTGSDLAERAANFGYDYWMIGENLAAGQTSPEQVVKAWMDSPEHRANMLQEKFTEVGVGFRTGGDYRFYWVLEFGDPQ